MPFTPRRKHHLARELYCLPGAYFITSCSHGRRHRFGRIENSEAVLSQEGNLLEAAWFNLPKHWRNLELDLHVVMPNHFHGIVIFYSEGYLPPGVSRMGLLPDLPRLVQGLKANATRDINRVNGSPGASVLQEDYYDHIIRGTGDLDRIRQYIVENPRAWELDRENGQRSGLHPLYAYLDSFPRQPKTRWSP